MMDAHQTKNLERSLDSMSANPELLFVLRSMDERLGRIEEKQDRNQAENEAKIADVHTRIDKLNAKTNLAAGFIAAIGVGWEVFKTFATGGR